MVLFFWIYAFFLFCLAFPPRSCTIFNKQCKKKRLKRGPASQPSPSRDDGWLTGFKKMGLRKNASAELAQRLAMSIFLYRASHIHTSVPPCSTSAHGCTQIDLRIYIFKACPSKRAKCTKELNSKTFNKCPIYKYSQKLKPQQENSPQYQNSKCRNSKQQPGCGRDIAPVDAPRKFHPFVFTPPPIL